MPKVPRARASQSLTVVPPGPRRSLSEAGMAGRSVSDLGRTVQRAGFLLQEKREDSFARDYIIRLADEERKLLYNPRTGLYEQEGSQAWKTTDKVSSWWEGHLKKIDELPVGQGAKERLKQSMMVRRENSLDHASRFEADQDRVYRDRVFKAEYRSVLDDSLTNWDQPDMIARNVKNLAQEIQARYGPEETRTQIAAMKDRIWGTAIIQAARADAPTGLAMLDKYKTQLSPSIENQLRKAISSKVEKDRAEEFLVEARKHHPDNFEAQHDFVDNAEGISRQFKEKLRGRIKSNQAEKKARDYEAREERRNAGFDAYWQAMDEKRYGEALKITEDWSPDDFSSEEKALAIDRTSKAVIKSNPYMEKALLWNIKIGEITNKAQLYNEPRTRNLTPASILQLKKDLNQELREQFGYREILEDIARIYKESNLDSKLRESPFLFFQFEFLAEIAGAEKQKKRRLTPSELRKTAENLIKLREKQTLRSWPSDEQAESEENLDNRPMKMGAKVFSTATRKLNDKKKASEVPEGISRTGLAGTGTSEKDSGKVDNPSPLALELQKEIALFDGLLENTPQEGSLYTTINNLKNQVSSRKNLDDLTVEELTSLKKEIENVVRERKNDIQLYKEWLDTKSFEPEFSERLETQIEINKYLVNRFESHHLINLKKALQKKQQ